MKNTQSKNAQSKKIKNSKGPDLTTEVPNLNSDQKEKEFHKDLSQLIEKHQIKEYAGVFTINGRQVLVFLPDILPAGRMLNMAYLKIRNQILNSMGEKSN